MRLSLALTLALALSLPAQVPPDKALATMKVGDGLQVQLFAAEPMLLNPTSMDIDPFGRVWVTEAVNYRYNSGDVRKTGDRIVILTDKDGDGKADESTTFYESKELHAPLGICIIPQLIDKKIGFRVLVSQSPNILEFWDRDGDLKADGPPTVFLTGFHGTNHDHGVHKIQVGPDGKLYFTVGDEGVKDLQGADKKGPKFATNRSDCQAGTVWRCDPDGKNLELVAHNFRNPYQVAVDSFGEIWTSDNDDDGNKQCRICVVYPGGNYGYWPRGPGESHWHQEQPGIVPNVLRTGFGSPTGLCFYEGSLLPEKFRGNLIAADAGPREITAYHRKPKGAGYELDKTLLLTSTDTWFRPSDVSVAPDGSLFVADWYDPGVGGHGIGDFTRGRIYRITSRQLESYSVPKSDFKSDREIAAAFLSPSQSSRIIGQKYWIDACKFKGDLTGIVGELKLITNDYDHARRIWLSIQFDDSLGFSLNAFRGDMGSLYLRAMSNGPGLQDQNFWNNIKLNEYEKWNTSSRRQMLIEMRKDNPQYITNYINELIKLYDGQDRFYLAALNIACGNDPKRRDEILKDFDKHFPEWNDKTAALVRELRPKVMIPILEERLRKESTPAKEKVRMIDCLAGYESSDAGKVLPLLMIKDASDEVKAKALVVLEKNLPGPWNDLAKAPVMERIILELVQASPPNANTQAGIRLAVAIRLTPAGTPIARLMLDKNLDIGLRRAAVAALGVLRVETDALSDILNARGDLAAADAARSFGAVLRHKDFDNASRDSLAYLQRKLQKNDGEPAELLNAILGALAVNKTGTQWLLERKEKGELRAELLSEAGRLLRNTPYGEFRDKARKLFPVAVKLDLAKLPAIADLAKKTGNAENGRKIFLASFKGEAQCMKCHKVKSEGGDIGPDLSAIGKKASRENLFESILQPSKAIADQYQTWKIETDGGAAVTGFIVKETPETITLRDANGKDHAITVKGADRKKLNQSIMADDLVKALTEQELIDLVEYLLTLKE